MVPRQTVLMSMQLSLYTNAIVIMLSARGYLLVLWKSSVECFSLSSYFCALYYLPWIQESKLQVGVYFGTTATLFNYLFIMNATILAKLHFNARLYS